MKDDIILPPLHYKDFYAFYLSIKKRGELLLSSFVISILIIPK